MPGKKVVFIAGTGHCGSTLLDLLLSSHSDVFGLGELWNLGTNEKYFKGEIPLCNINGFEDTFWTKARVQDMKQYFIKKGRWRRVLDNLLPAISGKRKLYQYLLSEVNEEVLVDSSKNPIWIKESLRKIQNTDISPYLIYLTRDGRSVINSYYQKYPQRGLQGVTANWIQRIEKLKDLYNYFDGNKTILSYENLTSSPKATMVDLCSFLDIPFEEGMMNFWESDHHHIGGNSGTKSLILSYRQKSNELLESLDERKQAYYDQHPLGIKADNRWERELSVEEIQFIESEISQVNFKYGL